VSLTLPCLSLNSSSNPNTPQPLLRNDKNPDAALSYIEKPALEAIHAGYFALLSFARAATGLHPLNQVHDETY